MKDKSNEMDPVERKAYADSISEFYKNRGKVSEDITQTTLNKKTAAQQIAEDLAGKAPKSPVVNLSGFKTEEPPMFNKQSAAQYDPDLTVGFELVPFPSQGIFYPSKISEVTVEYLTSKDEDVLSTASLIQNGTVLDILLKNKIKTLDIDTDDLLVGDRNAVLLFLRASSYGQEYDVNVTDPRNGNVFSATVDITKLKPKEIKFQPDEHLEFSFMLPIRQKLVKFKILNYREIHHILKNAERVQEAYAEEFSQFLSMKLKTEITEVNGKRDPAYISKFVDAMPARDSSELKKRIAEVTPDMDMNYEFKTTDGFKFFAKISVGVDFFFPFI